MQNHTLPDDRAAFLACIAMQEDRYVSSRLDHLDDEIDAMRSKGGRESDGRIDSLQSKVYDLESQVHSMRAEEIGPSEVQALRSEVRTLQSDLEETRKTVKDLCSAIKFSLSLNGTSATSSGGSLWAACSR